MPNKKITILHLYPELLNLYGDKGNISALKNRLLWRGIDAEVVECTGDDKIDFNYADIVFLGGGSDREQEIVCKKLIPYRDDLKNYIEQGGVLLATCGGFEMLGKYQYNFGEKTEGIGVLDIKTETGDRLIGNVVVESSLFSQKITGFENHSGRVEIGNYTPLGKIVYGKGNTGNSGFEGMIYKNVVATNLHGPILPKNPMLCDYILTNALKKKYSDFDELSPLDDTLENLANEYIENKYGRCR